MRHQRTCVDARIDGRQVNCKHVRRLWAKDELHVVVECHRKSIGVSTVPAIRFEKACDLWSIGFPFDSTIMGEPAKILSIVHGHTRECLGGIVDCSVTNLELSCRPTHPHKVLNLTATGPKHRRQNSYAHPLSTKGAVVQVGGGGKNHSCSQIHA